MKNEEMKELKIKELKKCWSGAEVLGDGGITGNSVL